MSATSISILTSNGPPQRRRTFRARLAALGFVHSMNRPGVIDNARMESFFHSMKADVVHGVRFTCVEALAKRLRYMPYYNRVRLHPGLGYRSPIDNEA